jgi:hypothetical protein
MNTTSAYPGAALTLAIILASGSDIVQGQARVAPPSRVRVYAGAATAPVVTIVVAPANPAIQPGSVVRFSATVTGTNNTAVDWTSSGGKIELDGTFTAGQTTGTFSIKATLRGGTLSGSTPVRIQSDTGGNYVDIAPGEDIQARIDQLPAGTAFRLNAGVHRLSAALVPKSKTTFTGEPGAVLSGSRRLTTFSRSGSYWVAAGQTQQGPRPGVCWSDRPRCAYPEDLFIDDVPLDHVASLAEVRPGTWHFDYGADRIYFADNPSGKRVETSVARAAFSGNASDVTIADLTIEKFANPAQAGAIAGESSTGWTVRESDIRFNHGIGLRIGHRMKVLGNRLHHNGQMGIGGVGDNVLVEDNEIAYNNIAGYEAGWEAGGTKFVKTNYLVVRNNFSHHNDGPGLWTDIDNLHTLYEGNRVEDNRRTGIFHEISYAALIRDNVVKRNGFGNSGWLWGAGILVAASPDVEIYGNTVEDNADGIAGVQQARGAGAYGPYETSNLWVHHNTITMSVGLTGFSQDLGDDAYYTSRNIRFDHNTYKLGAAARYFAWRNGERTEAEWRQYGHDVNGTISR